MVYRETSSQKSKHSQDAVEVNSCPKLDEEPRCLMDLRHTVVKMMQVLKGELIDQNEANYIREFLASKESNDP